MIDLHLHSNVSDGTDPPAVLAALAAEAGLTAAALTDHDTTGGNADFVAACAPLGVLGIAGVEISADFTPGTLHLLGYFPAPPGEALERMLERIRRDRAARNRKILKTLEGLGMPVSGERLAALAGPAGVVGRLHVARAMIECGYVKSTRMAFDRFLGRGRPAYVNRYRPAPDEAISAIRGAGGVAVLAHPVTLAIGMAECRRLFGRLRAAGLAGVEALYPEHSPAQRQRFATLARDHGLAVTGGSDYHGNANPAMGTRRGIGHLRVPDRLLVELEARGGCRLSYRPSSDGVCREKESA